MFFICSIFGVFVAEPLTINNAVKQYSFSAIKTKKEPFLDLKIPGLFDDFEDKNSTIFSYFERRKFFNFTCFTKHHVIFPTYEYIFKPKKLDEKDLEIFDQIKDKNPYFTIYLDSKKFNVPLFNNETNEIYTNYLFQINFVKRVKTLSNIVEGASVMPKLNEELKFNFSLIFKKIQEEPFKISQFSRNYLIFSCVMYLIISFINVRIRKMFKTKPLPIPYKEIWRMPFSIDKTLIAWNTGIFIITLIGILMVGKFNGANPGDFIVQAFIFSPFFANYFLGWWGNIMGKNIHPSQYVIPSYIVLLFAWLPYLLLTFITNKIFGTWRGPSLKDAIIKNLITFILQYFSSLTVGNFTSLIKPPLNIETEYYDFNQNEKRKIPSKLYLYDVCFAFSMIIFVFPSLKNIFVDYLIHSEDIDKITLISAIICAYYIISLFGRLRTYTIIYHSVKMSWMEGYLFRSFLTSSLFFITCLYFTFTEVDGTASRIYCIYFSYLIAFCSFFIIVFLNFTMVLSFILVTFEFPRAFQKVQ